MPLISGRAIPCPPEAEPAMPAITATARAAPIKGSPGKCVTQWTTCLNAGKASTAVPKPLPQRFQTRLEERPEKEDRSDNAAENSQGRIFGEQFGNLAKRSQYVC